MRFYRVPIIYVWSKNKKKVHLHRIKQQNTYRTKNEKTFHRQWQSVIQRMIIRTYDIALTSARLFIDCKSPRIYGKVSNGIAF